MKPWGRMPWCQAGRRLHGWRGISTGQNREYCWTTPRIEVAVTYTDNEIAALVQERKPLPDKWRTRLRLRPKRGHEERDLDCTGELGGEFRVILRQSSISPLDFTAILAVHVPQSNRIFRLRRYNGKNHEHSNIIEGGIFYDYHIHMATERYQDLGAREDAYAEVSDRYEDLDGALDCLFGDAAFDVPSDPQLRFF